MIHIGILEDNFSLRTSMVDYFDATGSFKVVFDFPKFSDFKKNKQSIEPDFVLMDVHLSDGSSIDHIQELLQIHPQAQVIFITADEKDELILKAIENGAKGYILKPFKMHDLVNTLEIVRKNDGFLELEVLRKLMLAMNKRRSITFNKKFPKNNKLSERENRVSALLSEGYSYKDIAKILDISYHTVNQHVKNVYQKLNINNKFDLITSKKDNLN